MDISYNELKNKEIINLNDGAKMGHIIDIVFESETGKVNGIIAPGEKKIFHKSNDFFIPLEKIRRIGDDVILVRVDAFVDSFQYQNPNKKTKLVANSFNGKYSNTNGSFIKFRRLDNKKYK